MNLVGAIGWVTLALIVLSMIVMWRWDRHERRARRDQDR